MNVLRHAARALRRELFAGDLLTVFAALVLGVAVMTAVGTLVDRVTLALTGSAAEVIGGDLGVSGRQDIPGDFAEEAQRRGLRSTRLVSFPSVLFHGDASQMANIKAVGAGYPLRGELLVARDTVGAGSERAGPPPRGEAYADPRLLEALGLKLGDALEFGAGTLRVTRVLRAEPDASGELMQLSPPLLVNRADVDAAGLLGPGSRASYRLMFAGAPGEIAALREWLAPRAKAYRLVGIEDTQRGVRGAFDRAGRFLALAALLAVLLAGVATALAANRFALRRIDQVAVLRCLGARQRDILVALALQLLLLAIPACVLGVGLGMLAQVGLVEALGSLIPNRLPLPQATPALAGAGIGLLLLLGFGLPPLLRLRDVPPMRVLNRSFAALPPTSLLVYAAALVATVVLAVYATGDGLLAAWVLGGLTLLAALAAAVGGVLLAVLRRLQGRLRGPWKLGLAALTRRRALSVVQLVGLSLSLCALLLLAVIGPGLLGQWRDRLPADTPNYFLMNIQPDQADQVLGTLRTLGVADAAVEPFSTGKLVAINGKPPQRRAQGPDDEGDGSDRPINFSWRHEFPAANRLLSGRFWAADSTAAEASVEEGWAQRYGLKLGDRITLLLGDQQRSFTVTNVRKADWDSFRVNFFLLLNAGAVQDAPYNLISAFHLPRASAAQLSGLSRAYPNVSLLDIDAILQRVREVIDRVAQAVQLVMGFSLLAGALVLLAALQATAGERRYDSAVLRTLGARRGQLRGAVLVEFGALGLLAAILAVGAAAIIGVVVAKQAFDLALSPPWPALLLGGLGGVALSLLAGWSGTRRILRTPPALALREP
ncbi:ABC transporter permease [Xanthomonas rydalmerensis]|uniref:FtsX-like permease family protein n=1 Tax=Xanthomonas rydalmerensis TaxID=3046274 RepID=A0ABZ0JK32_9XANT|nr:FtsX-like permease family protein [Xanthomonas sp. DM-2023]WOS40149.1 FtsX-like permease family protein [Xanthomonas sp. DM-2023]WOS44333.1 FtsX-like permease family protein [Xanthomonas sp. DM-2023]WOS48513.1 FtsX-like permease family protein [Xanthomonas sp. DM-2023]WOS52693.1 FtsX-like permease family protein [Xanthomonas sp. DM-2023]WOS56877.1 FtsX-like permease family protein [Xanthomonas sp. DM-2023]